MKKFLNKNTLLDLFFIFILSLTPLLWFKDQTIMLGHDNVFPLDPLVFLQGRLSTWIDHGFGQSQSLIMGTIPIHLIDAIPYLFGFGLQATQKIVYVFWFFMMGLSAYILASVLNKESRIFKLTAVIFYIFNFFILQAWWIGERTKFSAYIAFPLIIAIFIQIYRKKISFIKGGILSALIFSFFNAGGLYGISLYGGLFIGLAVFIIFFSLISLSKKDYLPIKRFFLVFFVGFFFFILLNSYYVFPTISKIQEQYSRGFRSGGGASGFVDWADEISANASFINILRLQGIADWYDNPEHPYSKYFLTNSLLIAISFLWPALTFFSLIFKRRNEKQEMVFYFFSVFLLGAFFAAGTHPPLGGIYEGFMKHIPGSLAFRSPYYKFAPAIFLSASFLIAFFVDHFQGKNKKIIFSLLIITVLIYHFPYFTGDFFSWRKGYSTRLTIPQYVTDFSEWINNEKKDDGRIVMLPPNNPDFQYSMYNWGYLSFQSLPTLFSNDSVIINNDRIYTDERNIVTALYNALLNNDSILASKLIKILRVKYFLVQRDRYNDPKSYITTDHRIYKSSLEKLGIKKEKEFGEWDVYKVDQTTLPQIFLVNDLSLLDGKDLNSSEYFDFFDDPLLFLETSGNSIISTSKFGEEKYYVPECLNCLNKNKPFVIFPQRNILPDSPFYELVLLNEKRTFGVKKGKVGIYNNLGISLKRISEIRQLIFENKDVPEKLINNYLALLNNINEEFKSLGKFEDRFQVADDLDHYMEAQKNFLLAALGSYATTGNKASILGKSFQAISSVRTTIDLYLFKLDTVNNRLYKFNNEKAGNYNIYLRKRDFDSILKNDSKIIVEVDEKDNKEVKYDKSSDVKWYDLGSLNFDKGSHQLLVSFSEPPNLIDELKVDKTEFNSNGENVCYTGGIKEFNNKNIYRLKVNYRNDFSEDLYLYIWELKIDKKLVKDVIKLKTGLGEEQFSTLIKSYGGSKGFSIGLCSRVLTKEVLKNKVGVNVSQIIDPDLILTSETKKVKEISTVNFKKISPTKYTVSFSNSESSFLAFMSRYDEGWILSGFEKNHFRINSYANGWKIDKKGNYNLVLEYKTQNNFRIGVFVSIISFIVCIFCLLHLNRNKIRK